MSHRPLSNLKDMNIIVTELCKGVRCYPELAAWARWFDDDPDSPDFNAGSYFEGDPDTLRCDGSTQYFLAVDLGDTRYVLTKEEVTDSEEEILRHFFSDNFQDHFNMGPQTWEHFHQSDRCIAYRGGSGYVYTIWDYVA